MRVAAQHFADSRCGSNIASDKGCVEITALVVFGNTERYCRNICFTLRTGDWMSRYTLGNTAGAFSSSEFIIELLMNVRFHFCFSCSLDIGIDMHGRNISTSLGHLCSDVVERRLQDVHAGDEGKTSYRLQAMTIQKSIRRLVSKSSS